MSDSLRLIVFQHVCVEHPGSFRDVMAEGGHTWHAVELDRGEAIPELCGFDAMLVMGGPMDVWQETLHPWLHEEKRAIRDWVRSGRPFLGMCLGAQLLAVALEGRVGMMAGTPEVGLSTVWQTEAGSEEFLFRGMAPESPCFQWHSAEVQEMPPGSRLLATSPGCRVQAFAWGSCAYGLQYHLELTDVTAREWGALPEYAAGLSAVFGPGALPRLEADIDVQLPQLRGAAQQLFSNFLTIAQRTRAARCGVRDVAG